MVGLTGVERDERDEREVGEESDVGTMALQWNR